MQTDSAKDLLEAAYSDLGYDQGELRDHDIFTDTIGKQKITVEVATDLAIASGLKEDVVGSLLITLAAQENGVDKSVAFAAIIAKAKQSRIKRQSKPNT